MQDILPSNLRKNFSYLALLAMQHSRRAFQNTVFQDYTTRKSSMVFSINVIEAQDSGGNLKTRKQGGKEDLSTWRIMGSFLGDNGPGMLTAEPTVTIDFALQHLWWYFAASSTTRNGMLSVHSCREMHLYGESSLRKRISADKVTWIEKKITLNCFL